MSKEMTAEKLEQNFKLKLSLTERKLVNYALHLLLRTAFMAKETRQAVCGIQERLGVMRAGH